MKIPVTYVIYRASIASLTAAILILVGIGLAGYGPLGSWHAVANWILSGF